MLDNILKKIGVGILFFDPDSRQITDMNPAAAALTGLKENQTHRTSLLDIFSFHEPFLTWNHTDEAHFENSIKRENKTEIQVWVSLSPLSDRIAISSVVDISLQKKKQAHLEQERDELREFFDNIPVAAYRNTGGSTGKFLLANPAQLKLFKCRTFEDFCRIPVSETYQNPSQREVVVKELQEKGYVLRKEIQLLKSDKTPFWGAITVQAVSDRNGKFKWFDGIIEDITERKQSEKLNQTLFKISNAISTAENLTDLYQSIFESLNGLMPLPNFYISLYDKEKNSIFFPFHKDEYDTENTFFLPIDNIEDCRLICVDVIKSRKPMFMKGKDCQKRASRDEIVGTVPAVWLGVPLIIRDEVIGTITVQHYSDPEYFTPKDIPLFAAVSDQIALAIDRKRAQDIILEHKNILEKTVSLRTRELQNAMEDLSESEKRFRQTIELLPEVMFETDESLMLTYANRKAFELFQYTREDMEKGLHFVDLVARIDRDRAREDLKNTISGRTNRNPEYLVCRKDNICFPAIINSRPFFKKEKFAGLRGVIIDITLQKKIQKEREERIGVDKEMEIAKNIQTSLLPCLEKFRTNGFEISANMTPAMDVGGDYFDILRSPDNRLWFGIGDVTGHGLVSGLIMMMAQVSVNTLIRSIPGLSPEDVLIHANRVIQSNIREGLKVDHHMTISFIVEEHDGVFRYAGAHEILLLYRSKTKTIERIPTKGMWLGIVPDISKPIKKYAGQFTLEKDDILLLYTDGVIEAFNEKREQYDLNRLEKLLSAHADQSTETIKQKLLHELNEFIYEQADDITFLILKKR